MRVTRSHVRQIGFLLVFAAVISGAADVAAVERLYLSSGTARMRSFAMGSAYSSVEDDFSAGLMNPAGFRMNASRTERRFRLFFNPVGSAAAFSDFRDHDLDYRKDSGLTKTESLLAASMLVKGAVFTTSAFDVGLVFHEPVIRDDSLMVTGGRFLSAERVTKESFHAAFANLKVAPNISVGATGILFRTRTGGRYENRNGYIFGVLMDPTPNLKVGFSYHEIPEDLADPRVELEHIEGGTVSGGVSFYPDDGTVIAVDVRNLNKENLKTSLEIHAGAERIFADRIALRGGFYREKGTDRDVVSLGAGILPRWGHLKKYRTSSRNDILSYTFIMEERAAVRYWHMVSLFLVY